LWSTVVIQDHRPVAAAVWVPGMKAACVAMVTPLI
jgi:hypothetical protein